LISPGGQSHPAVLQSRPCLWRLSAINIIFLVAEAIGL
jgi:hypothetical protein